MASFPKTADVVIIDLGGIVGTSVAHHLSFILLGSRNCFFQSLIKR